MPAFTRSLTVAAVLAASILSASPALAATPGPVPSSSSAATETRAVDLDAQFYLTIARATASSSAGKVDTAELQKEIDRLADSEELSDAVAEASIGVLRSATTRTASARDAYDAQVAAEQAAAAAAAQAAAEALAQANTPDGARASARSLAASQYGWGDDQFSCLDSLWQKESGWNFEAYNAGSGATGIPQSLPGSKMASAGADWQTNAATQVAWGLDYISRAYGTPCAAWGHSQSTNWY
ncbi:hypothetical protein AB0N73_06245 [Microbacterium sp. NPDC089189]|uniref:aggregation-promoting factor C-terminal-like domain-containing protein n=1 Tax=Microbacterium sp. NPDC089189 TaxID=3154972 RepID=UPI0034428555